VAVRSSAGTTVALDVIGHDPLACAQRMAEERVLVPELDPLAERPAPEVAAVFVPGDVGGARESR
jgi:hypothetical protein